MSMPTSRSPAADNDALNATLRLLALLWRSADPTRREIGRAVLICCVTALRVSRTLGYGQGFRPTSTTGAVDWRAV
jgi:hypothetical protein